MTSIIKRARPSALPLLIACNHFYFLDYVAIITLINTWKNFDSVEIHSL